jgi:hypothetical protein
MTMSPEAESYSLSDPMTVQKLERIYYEVLLKQDFCAILMAVNGTPEPYEDMARMRSRTISFLAQSQRQAFRDQATGLALSQLPCR